MLLDKIFGMTLDSLQINLFLTRKTLSLFLIHQYQILYRTSILCSLILWLSFIIYLNLLQVYLLTFIQVIINLIQFQNVFSVCAAHSLPIQLSGYPQSQSYLRLLRFIKYKYISESCLQLESRAILKKAEIISKVVIAAVLSIFQTFTTDIAMEPFLLYQLKSFLLFQLKKIAIKPPLNLFAYVFIILLNQNESNWLQFKIIVFSILIVIYKVMKGESESPGHNEIKPSSLQDEKVPQSKKYNNQKAEKESQINMNLIAQTSLDNSMTNALSQEQKIQMVLQLRSIQLGWLNIKVIQNLQVFQKLNVLYLQHNRIRRIQHLDCLINLEYLALNDNQITRVENLRHLNRLQGLNLNNNFVEELDPRQIPPAVQLLSFKNNPIALDANYKKDILRYLKSLQVLDDVVITPEQKIKALGKFPAQLLRYSQQMNQFRHKKQIETTLNQQDKPVLLGGQKINQKQAQSQIRQKTRKYLSQNQQVFRHQHKEQIQNFQQKITVSKNIRHIKEEEEKSRRQRLQVIRERKLQQIDREIQQIKRVVKSHKGLASQSDNMKMQDSTTHQP